MIKSEELKDIVDLSNTVPEEYRIKCFELILKYTLIERCNLKSQNSQIGENDTLAVRGQVNQNFVIPIDVKAFLTQFSLDESILWKCFIIENEEIRPIYVLNISKKSKVQISYALLLALQNALMKSGQFQFDIEKLRELCINQKCYDLANFKKNIKNNAKYFKSISDDQPIVLSPEGKTELANLLGEIFK